MKKLLAILAISAVAITAHQANAKFDVMSGAQNLQDSINDTTAKVEKSKADMAAKKAATDEAKAKKAAEQKAKQEAKKAELKAKMDTSKAKQDAKKKEIEDAGKGMKNSLSNLKKAVEVE